MLFVPGDRVADLLPKAAASGADAIIVDLEDALDPVRLDGARNEVAVTLGAGPARAASTPPVFVRINAVGSPWWEADIAAVSRAPVAGIVVPKCMGPETVVRVAKRWTSEGGAPLAVLALVETARGLLAASDIANADPSVVGLALGAEDLAAEIGIRRTPAGLEILHARSSIVLAAAAADRWSIDTPCLELVDLEAVERDAEAGAGLGFHGKLVVHPAQVAAVHRAFAPTAEEIDAARALLAAARDLRAQGRGVGRHDGRMIDRPAVTAAMHVLTRAGLEVMEPEDHVAER
jgi:citrate lyase subunit beta/citryl-CoA lyase